MTETTYDGANLWLTLSVPGVSVSKEVRSLGFQSQPYTSLLWFWARQVPSLRRPTLEKMLTRALLALQAGLTDSHQVSFIWPCSWPSDLWPGLDNKQKESQGKPAPGSFSHV